MHGAEAITFQRGDEKSLPHTLTKTRHLTLKLVDYDAAAETAILELHNPEAEPNEMVGALIEENAENVEMANEHRDKWHLPEKPVPVDTSTEPVETLHCRLHERLQIGDRVWTITEISADGVTVTPGHDHEARNLANELEDLEYTESTGMSADLNVIDDAF